MEYRYTYESAEREFGIGGGAGEFAVSSLGGGERSRRLRFEPWMCPHLCFWRGLNVGLKCFLLCGIDLRSLKEKASAAREGAVGPACHFRMMDEDNSRFVISDNKLMGHGRTLLPQETLLRGWGSDAVYHSPDDSVYACAYCTSVWLRTSAPICDSSIHGCVCMYVNTGGTCLYVCKRACMSNCKSKTWCDMGGITEIVGIHLCCMKRFREVWSVSVMQMVVRPSCTPHPHPKSADRCSTCIYGGGTWGPCYRK